MALALTHEFPITKSLDETFELIVDLDRIVPCVDGGKVLERLSPTTAECEIELAMGMMAMTFRGTVEIVEQDASAHRVVMEVKSKEITGQGDADATCEYLLAGETGTIKTEARITGMPMSMGEAVVLGILDAMIADFALTLSEQ